MSFNKRNKVPLVYVKEKLPLGDFNVEDLLQIKGKANVTQIAPKTPYWQIVGQMEVEIDYFAEGNTSGEIDQDLDNFSDQDEFAIDIFIKGFPNRNLSSSKDKRTWKGEISFLSQTIVSNYYYWQGLVKTEIIDIQLAKEGEDYYLVCLLGIHAEGPLSDEVAENRWWRGLQGDLITPVKGEGQNVLAWRGIVLDSTQQESDDRIEWQGQLLIQVILKDESTGMLEELWLQEPWQSQWVREKNVNWQSLHGEITELRALDQKAAFTLELTAEEDQTADTVEVEDNHTADSAEAEDNQTEANSEVEEAQIKENSEPEPPIEQTRRDESNWLKKWMQGSQIDKIMENKELGNNPEFESTLDTWLEELQQESQSGSEVWKQIKEEEEEVMENLKGNDLPEDKELESLSQDDSTNTRETFTDSVQEFEFLAENQDQSQAENQEENQENSQQEYQEAEIDSLLDEVYAQPEQSKEEHTDNKPVLEEFWNDEEAPIIPLKEAIEPSLEPGVIASEETTIPEETAISEETIIPEETMAQEDITATPQFLNTRYVDRKKDLSTLSKNMTQWTLYFVSRGETLGSIALQYGLDEALLRSRNNLAASDTVDNGDVLWISK